MIKSVQDANANADKQDLSTWQVAVSILASFFGVQKDKTLDRDFKHGKPSQFIIIGIVLTAIWYVAIYLVVKLVLSLVQ